MEVLKAKHKTPKISGAERTKRIRDECMSFYSDLFTICGYCGAAHHRSYVCHSCGFQLVCNDYGEEVWSNA